MTEQLPQGWEQVRNRTALDPFMDREYTALTYRHEPTGRRVYVSDVQIPNDFEGWGFLVRIEGTPGGRSEVVSDLDSAREVALEIMRAHAD